MPQKASNPLVAEALARGNKVLRVDAAAIKSATISGNLNTLLDPSCSVKTNIAKGDTSPDVKSLQRILNLSRDTQVAKTGAGSPGHESTFFGKKTYDAVVRFQQKYASEILISKNSDKEIGMVGDATLLKANQLCAEQTADSKKEDRQSPENTPASKAPDDSTEPKASGDSAVQQEKPAETSNKAAGMLWGAYAGGEAKDIAALDGAAGKSSTLTAIFWPFSERFPAEYFSSVGQKGKILVIFWEPNFGYDKIIDGSQDSVIRQFAVDAKKYGAPVILAPFNEMNLNEEAWGYSVNGNTAAKFKTAWKRMHDIMEDAGASNIKFAIDYNDTSIPNIAGNKFADYYPGDAYVDYVGVNGFNFGDPWLSFEQIFDSPIKQLSSFGKPIYILATASAGGSKKAQWIKDMGEHLKTYSNVKGWLWFNEDKEENWLINSDGASLAAFKSILP